MSVFLGEEPLSVFRAFTVAAVVGSPVMVIGDPGVGKTDPLLAALSFYVDGNKEAVWREILGAGTSPSVIAGTTNVRELVQNGRLVITREGTPFDPRFKGALFDELGRGNSAVLDAMLPVADWKLDLEMLFGGGRNIPPVRVATSNFTFKQVAKNERMGTVLQAIADRFLVLWVAPPNISKINFRELASSSVRRMAVGSFAEHQINVPDDHIDCLVPNHHEISAFRAIQEHPEVVRVWREANDLVEEKPLVVRIVNELAQKITELSGDHLSNRRVAMMIDMLLMTRLFSMFRSANPEIWEHARQMRDPRAWEEYAACVIDDSRRWSGKMLTGKVSVLGIEALRLVFPSESREEFEQWSEQVDKVVGGNAYVLNLVRKAYSGCTRACATADHEHVRRLQKVFDDLLDQDHVEAAKLVYIYARLAEGIISGNTHDSEHFAEYLKKLEPRSWPLTHEASNLAAKLANTFNFDNIIRNFSGGRTKRVRRA